MVAAVIKDARLWSRLGTWSSLVCAVHCIAIPWLGALLPFAFKGNVLSATSEMFLIGISTAFTLLALCQGVRQHGRWSLWVVGAVGLVSLTTGQVLMEESMELPVTIAGSAVLAGSLWLNYRLCAKCERCETRR